MAEPGWSPGLPGPSQRPSCGSYGRPACGRTWALPGPSWAFLGSLRAVQQSRNPPSGALGAGAFVLYLRTGACEPISRVTRGNVCLPEVAAGAIWSPVLRKHWRRRRSRHVQRSRRGHGVPRGAEPPPGLEPASVTRGGCPAHWHCSPLVACSVLLLLPRGSRGDPAPPRRSGGGGGWGGGRGSTASGLCLLLDWFAPRLEIAL